MVLQNSENLDIIKETHRVIGIRKPQSQEGNRESDNKHTKGQAA